jgi:tetraacyldisaccharide 4'-kinase
VDFMGLLDLASKAYCWAVALDRGLSRNVRLPAPVISVGNIAVGGRAKTPLVIEVCRRLKERGFLPVVLTRGYGRSSKESFWIAFDRVKGFELRRLQGGDPVSQQKDLASLTGDEALEIAILSGAEVLVGADRAAGARRYLQIQSVERPSALARAVFVLDDGFQHWKLQRDLDVVVIRPEDLGDRLLPAGRLRERPEALKRAGLVFELGRDLIKRSSLSSRMQSQVSATDPLRVVTTRAPDPDFVAELQRVLGARPFVLSSLDDHVDRARILSELKGSQGPLLMGWKEAAKFLNSDILASSKTHEALEERLSELQPPIELLELRLEFSDGGLRLDAALDALLANKVKRESK